MNWREKMLKRPGKYQTRETCFNFSLQGEKVSGKCVEFGAEADLVLSISDPPPPETGGENHFPESIEFVIELTPYGGVEFREPILGPGFQAAQIERGKLVNKVCFPLKFPDEQQGTKKRKKKCGFYLSISIEGLTLYTITKEVKLVPFLPDIKIRKGMIISVPISLNEAKRRLENFMERMEELLA